MSGIMLELRLEPAHLEIGVRTSGHLCLTNRSSDPLSMIRLSFRAPAGIRVLRGQTTIDIRRIEPGETVKVPLVVKGTEPGPFALEQLNLSYRDHRGRTQRFDGRAPRWQVRKPAPRPAPPCRQVLQPELAFDIEVPPKPLPLKNWVLLKGHLHNRGPGVARQITISLSDDQCWELRQPAAVALGAGEETELSLNLKPLDTGHILLDLILEYALADGSLEAQHWSQAVQVEECTDESSTAEKSPIHIEQMWQIEGDVGLVKQRQRGGEATEQVNTPACPTCGAPLLSDSDQRFCSQCGERIR